MMQKLVIQISVLCSLQFAVIQQFCYTGRDYTSAGPTQTLLAVQDCLTCINKFQFIGSFTPFALLLNNTDWNYSFSY